MRRRRQRIAWNIVIRVTQSIRQIEEEERKDQQEDRHCEHVFDGEIRVERQSVRFDFIADPDRVVRPRDMQRPDMQARQTRNHER